MIIDDVVNEGYDNPLTDDQWLTTVEVVYLLKVSRQKLATLKNKGLIKVYRRGLSGKNLYNKAELADLIIQQNTIRSI